MKRHEKKAITLHRDTLHRLTPQEAKTLRGGIPPTQSFDCPSFWYPCDVSA